jgi:hypothetical protein
MLYIHVGIAEKFTLSIQHWVLVLHTNMPWLSMGHCKDGLPAQAHHLTAWLNTALLVATGFNSVPRTASG